MLVGTDTHFVNQAQSQKISLELFLLHFVQLTEIKPTRTSKP
jgi:hypothetical protein